MRNFPIIYLLSLASVSYSQNISNVASSQEGNNALVTYDLNGSTGTSYYIKLYYSTDGGQNFSSELLQVTGDVKNGVKTGAGKKIIWAADKEVNYLNGSVIFKVEAEARKPSIKPITINNITIEITNINRNDDDLILDFIVTQNTEKEIIEIALTSSQLTTQKGKQYDHAGGQFGTKIINSSGAAYNIECLKGIPTRGVLRFKFEDADLVIPAVRISLMGNNSMNFVVRNIPMQ